MPVSVPTPFSGALQVIVANRAQDVPQFAFDVLRQHPVKANLILPTLEKRLAQVNISTSNSELWIIVHSNYAVKFIASVTQGYNGNYPLFIFTPIPYPYLLPNAIGPAVTLLAQALVKYVHRSRIYSVFAAQVVAETFAIIWTSLTNIHVIPEPYYHSYISYVTAQTFVNREIPAVPGAICELRTATMGDLNDVGELCHLFASDSAPFFLDINGALTEAEYLIRSRQCWVYTVTRPHQPTRIACLVAYTRNTENTATITKVITHNQFRSLGCAEKLVRKVCRSLLSTKSYVALFVGINNRAANVYRKVGFIGIGEGVQPVQDIDPYIELGFDRNHVQLGHW